MTQPIPPTVLGELTATGTGQARDHEGNLLDNLGNLVAPQQEMDTDR